MLKGYLDEEAKDRASHNDFGKNIIPKMLSGGRRMMAYGFEGYWKDVAPFTACGRRIWIFSRFRRNLI